MKFQYYILVIPTITLLGLSCKEGNDNAIFTKTSKELLSNIADSNYSNFEKMIYKNGDREYLQYYFSVCFNIIHSQKINIDTLPIIISEDTQIDGTKKVTIPLFSGFDSTSGMKKSIIELYYGPSELVPNNQITHFFIDDNYDVSYRTKLLKSGVLNYEFESHSDTTTSNMSSDELFYVPDTMNYHTYDSVLLIN